MTARSQTLRPAGETCHLCPDNANDTRQPECTIQHIEQLKQICTLPTLANAPKEKADWPIRILDMVQALADATLRTNPRVADARDCRTARGVAMNVELTRDDQTIRERVQAAGVVGAGGGGFPTHIKRVLTSFLVKWRNANQC